MTTTTADMRVWVGCLGCYNAGALVGEWVDGIEAEDLEPHDHLANAGISSPACGRVKADERWCLDLEGYEGFISGECSPMEAQRVAQAVEDLDDDERAAFGAWIGNGSGDIDGLDSFREAFSGEWPNFVEYAQELAEDLGAVDEGASWPNSYIDWERAARDLAMDYTVLDAPGGGVYVFRD